MKQRNEVEDLFTYHPPTPEKVDLHRKVDTNSRVFALWLFDTLPPSAERTLAIRAVHQARAQANAAIAVYALCPPIP
jgi:hypothetical protein